MVVVQAVLLDGFLADLSGRITGFFSFEVLGKFFPVPAMLVGLGRGIHCGLLNRGFEVLIFKKLQQFRLFQSFLR